MVATEFLHKRGLRLVRCSECAMVYVDPVPAEFASGEYYDTEAAAYYLSPAKLESDYAEIRFRRELRIFREHCPRGRVLDVGCSSGAFLYQLRRRFSGCYEVLGTDASGPALDFAETKGLPVVRGDFLRQDFTGAGFDAVTFWAVLEHLRDPGAFLEKAASLLNQNGFCFALVPNMRSLAARVLGARYRYIYPQHLNYFTPKTIERLVGNRFQVVDIRFTHFNPVVIWQDWRRGEADVSNEERARLLKQTTGCQESPNPLLKPLKLAYQLAEALLAKLQLTDNVTLVLRKKK
jgi:2-polyprenyl-3-methyl-5-hydroxy-6-metoxy-1,4-benzoquinol methylase